MAQHAPGFITASTVSPFISGKGDKLLAGGKTAAIKLAMERSGLVHIANAKWEGNRYTEWGQEHEDEAITRYEEVTFSEVIGKQVGVAKGWLSCTPDGYIGSDGLIEVKCPYMEHIYMDYLINPEALRDEYNDQVQFQLMLTGKKWCDLVAYHPHFDESINILITRIEPDKDWQGRCLGRITQVEAIIAETLEKIEQIKNGAKNG